MSDTATTTLMVKVPRTLKHRLKVRAAIEDITMTEIVIEAIEARLGNVQTFSVSDE